jgi:hypothetical protein
MAAHRNSSNSAGGGRPDPKERIIEKWFPDGEKILQLDKNRDDIASVKYSETRICLIYIDGREEIYTLSRLYGSRTPCEPSGLLLYSGRIICERDSTKDGKEIIVLINFDEDFASFEIKIVNKYIDAEGNILAEIIKPIFKLTLHKMSSPVFEVNLSLDDETIRYEEIVTNIDGQFLDAGSYYSVYCRDNTMVDGKFIRLSEDGTMIFLIGMPGRDERLIEREYHAGSIIRLFVMYEIDKYF